MVLVGCGPRGVPRPVLGGVLGGGLAAERLLSLGLRRIGFVGDSLPAGADVDLGFVSSRRRLDGYRRALRTAGIGYDPALVKCGSHDAAVAAELAAGPPALPSPPSGVFAGSDTPAIG